MKRVLTAVAALGATFALSACGESLDAKVSTCLGYTVHNCQIAGSFEGMKDGTCGNAEFVEDSSGNVDCG
jgi:hypothetical protein